MRNTCEKSFFLNYFFIKINFLYIFNFFLHVMLKIIFLKIIKYFNLFSNIKKKQLTIPQKPLEIILKNLKPPLAVKDVFKAIIEFLDMTADNLRNQNNNNN